MVAFVFPANAHALLSSTAATSAVRADVRDDFGAVGRRYVGCPRVERFDGKQLCYAQFRDAGVWRLRSYLATGTNESPDLDVSFARRWRRTLRTCHGSRSERRYAPGRLRSNYFACDYLMAWDIQSAISSGKRVRRAYVHGTNTAGFGRIFKFRCRQKRMLAKCHNGMHDRFTYRAR
jgi:hypothetical protein